MLILVAYSTVEGHTAKIARWIADTIEKAGHKAEIADLAQPGFSLLGRQDAVILCAPIHAGRYPPSMVRFLQNWRSALADKPSALVTVSLAIASRNPGEHKEAEGFPRMLKQETGYEPAMVHHAAGALKFLEYDFFKRWMLRRMSAKEGGPVDTAKDHELTDWAALDVFVLNFLQFAGRKR
jgi:menaquinone-dependent protoporphyrinogen oxidase